MTFDFINSQLQNKVVRWEKQDIIKTEEWKSVAVEDIPSPHNPNDYNNNNNNNNNNAKYW